MRRAVLVIDDNEQLAQALCRALKAANFDAEFLIPTQPLNFEVLIQKTEEWLTHSNQDSIIVVSIHLGERLQDKGKGIEYLKHLRGEVRLRASSLPIVLLSLDKPDQLRNHPDRLCFSPGCHVIWLLGKNPLSELKEVLNSVKPLDQQRYKQLLKDYIVPELISESFSVKHHQDIKAVIWGDLIYRKFLNREVSPEGLHEQITQHIIAWERLKETACRLGGLLRYASYCNQANSLESSLNKLITIGKKLQACLAKGVGHKTRASCKKIVEQILQAVEGAKEALEIVMNLTRR